MKTEELEAKIKRTKRLDMQLIQDNAQTKRGTEGTSDAAGLDAQCHTRHADKNDTQSLPPRKAAQL